MINVRVRTPSGSATISCSGDDSVGALKDLIGVRCGISDRSFDILSGYPLQPLTCSLEDRIENHIKNGDTLGVRVTVQSPSTPSAALPSDKPKTRPKRGSSPASQPSKTKQSVPFGSNIHSLGGKVHKTAKKSKVGTSPAKKNTVSPVKSNSSPANNTKRRTRFEMSSEEDIGTNLLAAVEGGSGKKNAFLRSVFKRAVSLEYDATKARARVASLLSGKYSIEKSQLARKLSGESTQLLVKFHKGIGSRSYHTETVDYLDANKLRAVVTLILAGDMENDTATDSLEDEMKSPSSSTTGSTNRDLLRPSAMAGCSPRVFWSLVHLYGPHIPGALQLLLPDKDWSWLTEDGCGDGEGVRGRGLSRKAQENLRQQQEQQEEKELKKQLSQSKKRKRDNNDSSETSIAGTDVVLESSKPCDGRIRDPESSVFAMPSTDQCQVFISSLLPNRLIRKALIATFIGTEALETSSTENNDDAMAMSLIDVLADTQLPPTQYADGEISLTQGVALLEILKSHLGKDHLRTSKSDAMYFVSLSHIYYWIESCRAFISNHFWDSIIDLLVSSDAGLSKEDVFTVLDGVCLNRPRDMSLWRNSASDLCNFMEEKIPRRPNSHSAPDNGVSMNFSETEGSVPIGPVKGICNLSHSFRSSFTWVDRWEGSTLGSYKQRCESNCVESDPTRILHNLESGGTEGEQWITILSCSCDIFEKYSLCDKLSVKNNDSSSAVSSESRIGEAVAVPVLHDEEIFENQTNGTVVGMIVAYLPATADEPMALWKAHLENGMYEDLEEQELMQAIREYRKW